MSDEMRIISLTAENVKRLKVVRIHPDGSLVVVGGKNGAGKSSVLDSIMAALGGGSAVPEHPVRNGQDKAFVEVDLGDLVVRRSFTAAGGSTLKVSNKDGMVYPSPQKMLDALVGKISFDPLQFSRMAPKDQVSTLKDITGLDFTELDRQHQTIYDTRREENRHIASLKAKIDGITVPDGTPDDDVNVGAIAEELQLHTSFNAAILSMSGDRDRLARDIGNLEAELERCRGNLAKCDEYLAANQPVDVSGNKAAIEAAQDTNRRVSLKRQKAAMVKELAESTNAVASMTERLDQIAGEKVKMIHDAKMPISDLTFGGAGVWYQGVPFEQASQAEQLRVSVAIGLAANPKLKVLLVRDGSLLDEDNLATIAEMAEQAGAQVWLERVGAGAEVSVLMEDGEVADASASVAP